MMREPQLQDRLFTEDVNDAMRDVVRALGGNKDVGRKLRPELTPEAAGGWLKDCLNPARRERLDPEQVMWLLREGRRVGCHSLMWFMCDDAAYARPPALEPQDEAAQLKRDYIESVRVQKRIAERLERLEGEGK